MRKQILVTGGTGYIGSHTAVELIESGYDVVIVDNLSNSSIDMLDGIEKITGVRPSFENFDLCDVEKIETFFSKYPKLEAIIHFAAYKAVGESVEKPLEYYSNNLVSLMNIMQGMRKHDIPNLVFSSSCTVYGEPNSLPVTEKAPVKKASSPYGNTKQIAEEIIEDTLNAETNLKTISLRYFNPIGAHPTAEIGELPIGVPQNLVPFITQTAIGLRDELKVFGNDYDTPDGTCIRDYINVVDLAKAHVVAIERLIKDKNKKNYEVFNLGTGKGNSVMEVITAFERATRQKLNYKVVGRRPGDVIAVYADTSYANEELGWKAEKDLDETLLSAWDWEKKVRNK
ncbi:MAG: UDP-glucose 4-epimerase GalE [Bacteroidota bacterium]